MSIRFQCPNGHELNVKDKYAGLTGLCPQCQVRVLVPVPLAKLSDDAIVDLLGPPPPSEDDGLPVHQSQQHRQAVGTDPGSSTGKSLRGISPLNRGMKMCPKCRREVRAVYDICPHCRTYFSDAAEVNRRMAQTCRECGAEYEPHLIVIWCKKCGADMRS